MQDEIMKQEKLRIDIDIENNLKKYLPSIFDLLGENKISWTNINKLTQKEFNRRIAILKAEGRETLIVEGSFVDAINRGLKGEVEVFNYLFFLNALFTNLSKSLSKNEKKWTAKTIRDLLTVFDKNYRNFIGEFAILNKFKMDGYTLLRTEQPLNKSNPKGVSADFLVQRGEIKGLIEVVNIHPEEEHFKSIEVTKAYLTSKIEAKRKTLMNDNNFKVWIAPVIWAPYADLEKIYECVEHFSLRFDNTIDFQAYAFYVSSSGERKFRFSRLKALMLDESKSNFLADAE